MSNFDELDPELEARLKRYLHPMPAPEGFADRVMQQVAAQQRHGRLITMSRRTVWRANWMALAAMLLVGIALGGWQWRQRELRKEREQARIVQRQFDMAMQVTQRTLIEVQARVGKTVRDSVRQ